MRPHPGIALGTEDARHTRRHGPRQGVGGPRTRPPEPRPGHTLTFSPLGPTSPGVPGKPCGPVSPWKTEAGSRSGRRRLCVTTGSGTGGQTPATSGPPRLRTTLSHRDTCTEPTAVSCGCPRHRAGLCPSRVCACALCVRVACAWVTGPGGLSAADVRTSVHAERPCEVRGRGHGHAPRSEPAVVTKTRSTRVYTHVHAHTRPSHTWAIRAPLCGRRRRAGRGPCGCPRETPLTRTPPNGLFVPRLLVQPPHHRTPLRVPRPPPATLCPFLVCPRNSTCRFLNIQPECFKTGALTSEGT